MPQSRHGILKLMMSSRDGLRKASKRLVLPRSSAMKRRRTEGEAVKISFTAPVVEEEDSELISDEGEECPVAMGTPDPSYVLSVYEKRKYNVPTEGEEDTLFCRILNRRVDPSCLSDRHWCSCGNCVLFSQPRENLCCQEVFRVASSPFTEVVERMKEKMENMDGCCITAHPSFRKVVLDKEVLRKLSVPSDGKNTLQSVFQVLSLLLENGRFEARGKRGALEKIEEQRRYRYYVYRSFVLWAYGHLGLGNRLEIPACVRSTIMKTFPSQDGYVGFRSSGIDNAPMEGDDSCWYGDTF
ncbi:hypothetical protein Y032_0841g2630 [Ancylostoma ceylanicum]|uniref:P2X purinoreceptor 7 intracellular domain-containing protein n=1 Tax=Ancylostoma ceylanicum TaxID=53326 RepID=A0A016WAU7_9BILA|nr:hypothetical protein Y032_0841g2630 [Ancylostoma ceylanicum]